MTKETAAKKLTETFLQNVKTPAAGREEYPDGQGGCPGLRLRVYATGRKAWLFEKRVKGGPKRKHTIGTYPELSLKAARDAAREIAVEAAKGIDRIAVAEEAASQAALRAMNSVSVREVLDAYQALHLDNLRTGDERRRTVEEALRDYLDQPVADLTRRHLQLAIDDKARSGAKVRANRMKAALSHFAKFAWQRSYLDEHIGLGLAKAVAEYPRDRVLSIEEMKAIWAATYEIGDPWGPVLRLLILTAQRKGEIAGMTWANVNFRDRYLAFSTDDTKNRQPHIVHLSQPALDELEALYEGQARSELLFTTTGTTPISGFGKMKKRFDRLLGEGFEPWRFHDIRTAFATAMVDRGELEVVVDRVLNHVASGSAPSAVARAYNKALHLDARKRVIERWGATITGRGGSEADQDAPAGPAKVVAIR